jgi:predicted methyltransferase
MKPLLYFLSMLLVLGVNACSTIPVDDNNADLVAAAIANPNRTDADRERDARDKPEATLALLNLQPGQSVVDLFAGGGYYSELMAGVVGEQGMVILHNNDGYAKWVEKYIQERYIDNTVPPITVLRSEVADLQLLPATFDVAVMVMSYHDLYYYNPERGFDATDVAGFFAQVRTALKPGGRLLLIDHSAPEGSGKTLTQEIHRIDEAFAREDVESYGFNLIATSDVLRHPEDPRTAMVFAKDIRGKTDRFVMLFQKQ